MSAQRSKRRLGSRRSAVNQNKTPGADGTHASDSTDAPEHHNPQGDDELLSITSNPDSSLSEHQHHLQPELKEKRRKTGSRRKNKEKKCTEETTSELYNMPREEVGETTWCDTCSETQLEEESENQAEPNLSVVHKNASFSNTEPDEFQIQIPAGHRPERPPEIVILQSEKNEPENEGNSQPEETIHRGETKRNCDQFEEVEDETSPVNNCHRGLPEPLGEADMTDDEKERHKDEEEVTDNNDLSSSDQTNDPLNATKDEPSSDENHKDQLSQPQHSTDEQTVPRPSPRLNRRKLGSSRRNKRQLPQEDSAAEQINNKTVEEDEETEQMSPEDTSKVVGESAADETEEQDREVETPDNLVSHNVTSDPPLTPGLNSPCPADQIPTDVEESRYFTASMAHRDHDTPAEVQEKDSAQPSSEGDLSYQSEPSTGPGASTEKEGTSPDRNQQYYPEKDKDQETSDQVDQESDLSDLKIPKTSEGEASGPVAGWVDESVIQLEDEKEEERLSNTMEVESLQNVQSETTSASESQLQTIFTDFDPSGNREDSESGTGDGGELQSTENDVDGPMSPVMDTQRTSADHRPMEKDKADDSPTEVDVDEVQERPKSHSDVLDVSFPAELEVTEQVNLSLGPGDKDYSQIDLRQPEVERSDGETTMPPSMEEMITVENDQWCGVEVKEDLNSVERSYEEKLSVVDDKIEVQISELRPDNVLLQSENHELENCDHFKEVEDETHSVDNCRQGLISEPHREVDRTDDEKERHKDEEEVIDDDLRNLGWSSEPFKSTKVESSSEENHKDQLSPPQHSIEEQTVPRPSPRLNRRKLGSSRRNKRQLLQEDSAAEQINKKTVEEDEETEQMSPEDTSKVVGGSAADETEEQDGEVETPDNPVSHNVTSDPPLTPGLNSPSPADLIPTDVEERRHFTASVAHIDDDTPAEVQKKDSAQPSTEGDLSYQSEPSTGPGASTEKEGTSPDRNQQDYPDKDKDQETSDQVDQESDLSDLKIPKTSEGEASEPAVRWVDESMIQLEDEEEERLSNTLEFLIGQNVQSEITSASESQLQTIFTDFNPSGNREDSESGTGDGGELQSTENDVDEPMSPVMDTQRTSADHRPMENDKADDSPTEVDVYEVQERPKSHSDVLDVSFPAELEVTEQVNLSLGPGDKDYSQIDLRQPEVEQSDGEPTMPPSMEEMFTVENDQWFGAEEEEDLNSVKRSYEEKPSVVNDKIEVQISELPPDNVLLQSENHELENCDQFKEVEDGTHSVDNCRQELTPEPHRDVDMTDDEKERHKDEVEVIDEDLSNFSWSSEPFKSTKVESSSDENHKDQLSQPQHSTEEQTVPRPSPRLNRRKLGSSRRNKRQLLQEDSAAEQINNKTVEEDEETEQMSPEDTSKVVGGSAADETEEQDGEVETPDNPVSHNVTSDPPLTPGLNSPSPADLIPTDVEESRHFTASMAHRDDDTPAEVQEKDSVPPSSEGNLSYQSEPSTGPGASTEKEGTSPDRNQQDYPVKDKDQETSDQASEMMGNKALQYKEPQSGVSDLYIPEMRDKNISVGVWTEQEDPFEKENQIPTTGNTEKASDNGNEDSVIRDPGTLRTNDLDKTDTAASEESHQEEEFRFSDSMETKDLEISLEDSVVILAQNKNEPKIGDVEQEFDTTSLPSVPSSDELLLGLIHHHQQLRELPIESKENGLHPRNSHFRDSEMADAEEGWTTEEEGNLKDGHKALLNQYSDSFNASGLGEEPGPGLEHKGPQDEENSGTESKTSDMMEAVIQGKSSEPFPTETDKSDLSQTPDLQITEEDPNSTIKEHQREILGTEESETNSSDAVGKVLKDATEGFKEKIHPGPRRKLGSSRKQKNRLPCSNPVSEPDSGPAEVLAEIHRGEFQEEENVTTDSLKKEMLQEQTVLDLKPTEEMNQNNFLDNNSITERNKEETPEVEKTLEQSASAAGDNDQPSQEGQVIQSNNRITKDQCDLLLLRDSDETKVPEEQVVAVYVKHTEVSFLGEKENAEDENLMEPQAENKSDQKALVAEREDGGGGGAGALQEVAHFPASHEKSLKEKPTVDASDESVISTSADLSSAPQTSPANDIIMPGTKRKMGSTRRKLPGRQTENEEEISSTVKTNPLHLSSVSECQKVQETEEKSSEYQEEPMLQTCTSVNLQAKDGDMRTVSEDGTVLCPGSHSADVVSPVLAPQNGDVRDAAGNEGFSALIQEAVLITSEAASAVVVVTDEGDHSTHDMKNTEENVGPDPRRRKMGSTRKSLRPRAPQTNPCQDEDPAVDKNHSENPKKDSEQIEQGAVEDFPPDQSHMRTRAPQTPEKKVDAEAESSPHHLPLESLTEKAPCPTDGVTIGPAAGARRRKMGSHRKSHQHPSSRTETVNEGTTEDGQGEEGVPSQTNESSEIGAKSEVEKNGKESSSSVSIPVERPQTQSEKKPEAEIPVQPPRAEVQLDLQTHSFSLAGPAREANLRSDLGCYHVLLIGDSSVGKTSFIKRAQSGKFSLDTPPSVGLDSCKWTVMVDGKQVVLQLWDTAGQERFHSITRQVFHKAQAFLLMYDVTSSHSFSAVTYWTSCIKEGSSENVIVLLLGNKNDCEKRQVETEDGLILSKELNCEFMECSAATGENVIQSLETVARLLQLKVDTREEALVLHKDPPQKKRSGCC